MTLIEPLRYLSVIVAAERGGSIILFDPDKPTHYMQVLPEYALSLLEQACTAVIVDCFKTYSAIAAHHTPEHPFLRVTRNLLTEAHVEQELTGWGQHGPLSCARVMQWLLGVPLKDQSLLELTEWTALVARWVQYTPAALRDVQERICVERDFEDALVQSGVLTRGLVVDRAVVESVVRDSVAAAEASYTLLCNLLRRKLPESPVHPSLRGLIEAACGISLQSMATDELTKYADVHEAARLLVEWRTAHHAAMSGASAIAAMLSHCWVPHVMQPWAVNGCGVVYAQPSLEKLAPLLLAAIPGERHYSTRAEQLVNLRPIHSVLTDAHYDALVAGTIDACVQSGISPARAASLLGDLEVCGLREWRAQVVGDNQGPGSDVAKGVARRLLFEHWGHTKRWITPVLQSGDLRGVFLSETLCILQEARHL